MICVIVLIFLSITYTSDISGMIFEEQEVANNITCSLVLSALGRARLEKK